MSDGRPSKWSLLRPKWLLLLAVLIAACIAMALLGRWQWRAARDRGDITNYSYACQWWAFTVFAVIMYARIIRDHLSKPARRTAEPEPEVRPARYLAYVAPASSAEVEHDPERIRMNNYLAALYAADDRVSLAEQAAEETADQTCDGAVEASRSSPGRRGTV